MSNEVSLGLNLYEANQQLMSKEKPLDAILLNRSVLEVAKEMTSGKYYMLLNKEKSNYTIFNVNEETSEDFRAKEIIATFQSRGNVLSIDKLTDNDWEVWIRTPEEENLYYRFFACDKLVVEV